MRTKKTEIDVDTYAEELRRGARLKDGVATVLGVIWGVLAVAGFLVVGVACLGCVIWIAWNLLIASAFDAQPISFWQCCVVGLGLWIVIRLFAPGRD